MSEYCLTYFDARGRAEPLRMALVVAEQTFEDKRIKGEDWEKLKSEMPQGTLPVLSVDGCMFSQSTAILRYIAREHNLYGDCNKSMTTVDMIISTFEEFFNQSVKTFMEHDEQKKQELIKEFGETVVPKFVKVFNKILSDNPENSGWFVGTTMTVADIVVFCMLDGLKDMFGEDAAKAYLNDEKLVAHNQKVGAVPAIREWIEKRPQSLF